jgi:heme-degrading monooxygenase HmoA
MSPRQGLRRAFAFVLALWPWPGVLASNEKEVAMNEDGMVMTVLEAEVARSNWPKLEATYADMTGQLPPGLVRTFLVQDQSDSAVWRIITVWESRDALDQMRRSTETPGGVLTFRAAGAEPRLRIFDVRRHVHQ